MTPVTPQCLHDPQAKLVIYAEDQPEYLPLPASKTPDGQLMTEWEPTAEERAILVAGGRIRLWIHTFGDKLQPVMIEAVKVETPQALVS